MLPRVERELPMDIDKLFNIAGKTALVTGGSAGIGAMIAEGLVKAGAKVWICSRKAALIEEAVTRLEKFGEIQGFTADLATEQGVNRVRAVIGEQPLHILVNNAGVTWGAPIDEFPRAGFEKVLNLNLLTPFELIKSLLPNLRAAGRQEDPARIINIASLDASRVPLWESYPYSATKAGLVHMSRHLGKFLAKDHISVNTINPGIFPTQMSEAVVDFANAESVHQVESPLSQRIGTAEDITGAVIYLSSRAGAWLTGISIPVGGGIATIES